MKLKSITRFVNTCPKTSKLQIYFFKNLWTRVQRAGGTMKINSTKIAEIANVSRSTVSRVINNNPDVNEETRKKVLKIIKQLNYTPNTNAQTLVGKKNDVIGLFIFDKYQKEMADSKIYFEYFMNFITTLTREAFLHKKQILVDIVDGSLAESRLKGFFQNGNISAGIFIGSTMNNEFIDKFIKEDFPISIIDYSTDETLITDNIKLINSDDYTGAYNATCELINEGCRKIIHICGDMEKLSAMQRKSGYLKALEDNNIFVSQELIIEAEYKGEKAYALMKNLIENNVEFDGIFCASDTMAHSVVRLLTEAGIKNTNIWGYDNLRGSLPLGIKSVDPRLEITAVKSIDSLFGKKNLENKIQYTEATLIKTMENYLNF